MIVMPTSSTTDSRRGNKPQRGDIRRRRPFIDADSSGRDALTTIPILHPANETVSALGRIGFAARGLVYLLIGTFATLAAFRPEQAPHGFTDSAQALIEKPFGNFVVLAIAVGLACLAGWLTAEALWHYTSGRGYRRWLLGVGRLGDAILYAGLMFALLGLLFGWRVGGEYELHRWVARLFSSPGGRSLAGIIGFGLALGGIGLIAWAWTHDIVAPLDMPPAEKRLTRPVSRCGVSGRGVALALIGFYLVSAAIHGTPTEAHELGGLLQHLRHTAYGWVLLLSFGAAFGASAVFDFLAAFYRRPDA
jgi:hypothetical protein